MCVTNVHCAKAVQDRHKVCMEVEDECGVKILNGKRNVDRSRKSFIEGYCEVMSELSADPTFGSRPNAEVIQLAGLCPLLGGNRAILLVSLNQQRYVLVTLRFA